MPILCAEQHKSSNHKTYMGSVVEEIRSQKDVRWSSEHHTESTSLCFSSPLCFLSPLSLFVPPSCLSLPLSFCPPLFLSPLLCLSPPLSFSPSLCLSPPLSFCPSLPLSLPLSFCLSLSLGYLTVIFGKIGPRITEVLKSGEGKCDWLSPISSRTIP